MRFTKMHGTGNDYVYVDGFRDALPGDPASVASLVAQRNFGIGSDGLILICPSDAADAEMRMFNADGSSSQMCGNGIRCVGKYLYDHGLVGDRRQIQVATGAGILTLELEVNEGVVQQVRVDMGEPCLDPEHIPTTLRGAASGHNRAVNVLLDVNGMNIPVTSVSMGNPHCVVYVDEIPGSLTSDMDRVLSELGPAIEHHDCFPDRVNVEFVTVVSRSEVRQRTWERGSGETLACGTGASAVCVAGVLRGRTDRAISCHLRGGTLQLEWDEVSNHVFMTGPAVEVYRGEIDLPAGMDASE